MPGWLLDLFARYGYISVMQDCRGRFESEGEYDTIFQEVADGYDAVEWAARLPWSNGRVGTTGQSYLGLTQYMIACNDPMPPSHVMLTGFAVGFEDERLRDVLARIIEERRIREQP